METDTVNASEWMPAKKVYEALTADVRDPGRVENMLALYLRNGSLRAHADAIWRSDERFTTQAWKSCPDDAIGGPIPLRYWRFEKALAEDRLLWRFVANRFLATIRLKPLRRIMMKGVAFSVADLQKLQPAIFSPGPEKRKRGPNADIGKRDAAWLTLLDVLFDTKSPAATWQTINDLNLEMLGKQTSDFGQRNRAEVASLALNRLKKHGVLGFVAGAGTVIP